MPWKHLFLPLRRSLLARLVATFFLFSAAIVMLLGAVSYLWQAHNTRHAVIDQISAFAELREQALNAWVQEQARLLTALAGMPETRRLAAELTAPGAGISERLRANGYFRRMQRFSPELVELSILAARGGRVVYSTDANSLGQYRVLDSAFVEGLRGTFVSSVHPSPDTLQPTMVISAPLLEEEGAPLGVLAASLNLESMDRIVQVRAGLGKAGEAYLVDRFHILVSAARFGRADFPRGVHSRGIDAAVNGQDGAGVYVSYRGVPVIGVYRWIAAQRLALLIEIPAAAAFAGARQQALRLLALGLSLVAALAVGVYFIALRIAKPILAVRRAAVRVAAGGLDAEAPVLTGDEIGELAVAFNRMTARLREVYAELSRREERFRSLIENSSDMIIVVDASGRPTFLSPSVERLLGYPAAELLGRDCLQLVHEEDRPVLREQVADRLLEEGLYPGEVTFRLRHRDGSWRVLEATGRNLLAEPNVAGIIIDARDITERRRLEDQLAQAQKMEAIGRLASGIAHDFNNLLTAIIGYSELLAAGLSADREKSGEVAEIRLAAERAAALTRQLLAFSRKQILRPRPLNLNRLILAMGNMLERLIGENIRLEIRPAEGLWTVLADPSQMEQVLLNITLNARDAISSGGRVLIETSNAPPGAGPEDLPGPCVQLCVTDTGRGMDQETLSRLFEPFFTTKRRGTGLGLATVYGIVRQSGGQVAVSSQPGRGSTFRIFLPAEAGQPEEAPAGGQAPREAGGTSAGGPPQGAPELPTPGRPEREAERVFVTEDEPAVNRMIVENLRRLGYQVASALNPAEALAAGWGPIDLLVTDVVMPGMSGGELAEQLQRSNPRMRVLFISGYMEAAEARRSVQVRGTAFLQKPFAFQELARAVREALAPPA